MRALAHLPRFLCFSAMQTYYLGLLLLGLCGTCVYFLIYRTARIASPLDPCLNTDLYMEGRNLTGAGFMMALDYSDQLTGGGMNLFCLQCLAYSIDPGLVVVEPFIVQSTFGATLDLRHPAAETPWKGNAIRLSGVYDIKKWQAFSKEKCFSPLAPWESLLDVAPRNVVLVQHTWNTSCSLNQFRDKYSPFFHLYRFKVVREVCFNFKFTGELELWRYKHSIYGELDPRTVTVIHQKWLGVGKKVAKFAVSISDSHCEKEVTGGPLFNNLNVAPSDLLSTQADTYISHYLGGVSDHQYIAVMLRVEQIFVGTSKKVNKLRLVSRCLFSLTRKWQNMKRDTGLTETFLALDYGKFGSKGFLMRNYTDKRGLEEKLSGLLSTMGQGDFRVWESKFREVAGTENPGYIASLQQTIASRARCLITVGGGSFQNHAFVLHKEQYGKTCHIRMKSNCRMFDSLITYSLFKPTTASQ